MHLATTSSRAPIVLVAVSALTCVLSGAAQADRFPLTGYHAIPPSARSSFATSSGLIVPVDRDSVPCPRSATFTDVAGGDTPGTNYDGLVTSGGVQFAERFAGQTLNYSGDFDVPSGIPTGPLTLQVGSPGQNLDVFAYTTNVLAGLGPLGFPDMDAIGEGSIAMIFPIPQSRVSMEIVGGNGGSATLGFYRPNGSLIDTVVLSGLGDLGYGFATADGSTIIGGILIQNTDASGVGVVNICHDSGTTTARTESWGGLKLRFR